MQCPKCGSYVNDFSRYCTRCGTDVYGAPAYDASLGKRRAKHMAAPHTHTKRSKATVQAKPQVTAASLADAEQREAEQTLFNHTHGHRYRFSPTSPMGIRVIGILIIIVVVIIRYAIFGE
jgi:hypothetical protein